MRRQFKKPQDEGTNHHHSTPLNNNTTIDDGNGCATIIYNGSNCDTITKQESAHEFNIPQLDGSHDDEMNNNDSNNNNNGDSNKNYDGNNESSPSSENEIPRETATGNNNSNNSDMRVITHEYVDEFGEIHSYEMMVTLEEYNKYAIEKQQHTQNTSQNSHSQPTTTTAVASSTSALVPTTTNTPTQPKVVSRSQDYKYNIKIFGKVYNLFFDRLTLESLFDRDHNPWIEIWGCPLTAFGVAWMGLRLLALLDKNWASIIFMIFAIAQSHFALIKSPKPEANSPFHFSRGTAFSRSFYLLFFGTIALICKAISRVSEP